MPLTKVSSGVIAANAINEGIGSQSITGDKLGLTAINANNIVNASITVSQLATSLNLATNNVQVASIQTATGTPAITFAANGQMTLANTPLQLTGGQIKFPATHIPSADGNTLDDYEEGTWTPTITAYAGSITAYTSQGSYVKIGRIVFATAYAVVSNAGTASGAYIISNLPFPLATSAEVYGYGVNLINNVGLVAYGSGSTSLYCFTAAGAFPGGSGTYVTLNFNYSV